MEPKWIYDHGYPFNRHSGSMTCKQWGGTFSYISPTLRCYSCWDTDRRCSRRDFDAIREFHLLRLELQRIYEH